MRVALYCRVSTDEQKQGGTIESQIKELEVFAASRNDVVVQKYIDESWSGSLLNRPALDALRDAAEQKEFDAVLINDVDRLSRDIANLAVVKRDLERKGVDVIFRKLPTDKGPLSDFMVNILGSFAEFERAMITDRTRRGRRYKVQERQLIMGNQPPYGYSYVKKDRDRRIEGHYEIRPDEARVVRMMFEWVASEGLSDRAVLRRLTEYDINARKGRPWAWSSVHRVLTNETYVGVTYYNKLELLHDQAASTRKWKHRYKTTARRLRAKAKWIPIPLPSDLHIIDRGLFDHVQARRQRNQAFSPRNLKHFYLLRKVRKVCGRCGWAYVGTPMHGLRYYRCGARGWQVPGKPRCRARIVSAKTIEPLVWQAIENAVRNPEIIIEQVSRLQEQLAVNQAVTQAETATLQHDLATLGQEEDRVLAAYRTGVTSIEQFENEIAKVNERRMSLQAQLAQAARHIPNVVPLERLTQHVTQWSTVAGERLGELTDDERAEFLGLLLEGITIHDDRITVRGVIPISGESVGDIVPMQLRGHGHNATHTFEFKLTLAARSRGPVR